MPHEIICLRGGLEPAGRGLYRSAFRVGEYLVKVHPAGRDVAGTARRIVERNLELREKLDFLPKFYGAAVTVVREDDLLRVVVLTFHERIEPVRISRLPAAGILEIVKRAADAGFVLDMKPSNFGEKDGRVYYLDEGGIGRGPIPPDVEEEWREFLRSLRLGIRGR
jgi:hypothetical protein